MTQNSSDDPIAANNQGLPQGSKLDSEPELEQAGTGSFQNRKKSPERQKVKPLNIHADPYGPRKEQSR
jgi:hypothetical protein